MKYFKFTTLVILFIIIIKCNGSNIRIKTASHGIVRIIDGFSEYFNTQFNLIIFGNNSNLLKIADEIIKLTKFPVAVKKRVKTAEEIYYVKEIESTVALFDDYHSFDFLMNEDNPRNTRYLDKSLIFPINFKKFFMFEYRYSKNVLSSQTVSNKTNLHHYRFKILHESDKKLLLFNNLFFTEQTCVPIEKVVNNFTFKWFKNPIENIQQFKNFHGCSIKVTLLRVLLDNEFFSMKIVNQKIKLIGIWGELLNEFARIFNFAFDIILVENYQEVENSQINLIYFSEIVHSSKSHPAFRNALRYLKNYQFALIDQDRDGYCVTYGAKYDPFEKLILPFDGVTWYLVISSFAIGFLTIFVLYINVRLHIKNSFLVAESKILR